MKMFGDRARRFERIAVGGFDNKLSGRHYRAIEGAGLVELSELVDIAQLAESLARIGLEPSLELGVRAAQLDEAKLASAVSDAFLERGDECVRNSRFRGEGHDHTGLFRGETGVDRADPDFFAQRDEWRRSEWEQGGHEIYYCVVVEETIPCLNREQFADGELADARASEEEDDLGSHAPIN